MKRLRGLYRARDRGEAWAVKLYGFRHTDPIRFIFEWEYHDTLLQALRDSPSFEWFLKKIPRHNEAWVGARLAVPFPPAGKGRKP